MPLSPEQSPKVISPSARHLAFLDAMRGIAVLGVVLVHSGVATLRPGSRLLGYAFLGQRGVELFYMVSAFTLFLARDTHQGREHFPTANFFIRRFFRIAPLYYTAIALNLALHGLRPRPDAPTGLTYPDIFSAICFVNAWKPFAFNSVAIGGWSVAIESMFYFTLPLLYKRVVDLRSASALFLGSFLICPLISEVAARISVMYRPYFVNWFPVHFPVFVMGIVGYFIWKGFRDFGTQNHEHRALSLVLLTASGVLILACIPISGANLYASCFAFLIFVLSCSLHPWKLFVNPIMCFLGRISFSIYLLHFFVVLGAEHLLELALLRYPALAGRSALLPIFFLFVLGVSVSICTVSWRYIEQPGIRLGRRWINARELRATFLAAKLHRSAPDS